MFPHIKLVYSAFVFATNHLLDDIIMKSKVQLFTVWNYGGP